MVVRSHAHAGRRTLARMERGRGFRNGPGGYGKPPYIGWSAGEASAAAEASVD